MRHTWHILKNCPKHFSERAYGKPRNSKYSLKGIEFEKGRQMVYAMKKCTDFAIEESRGFTVHAYMKRD
jgi:hypothetical protein